VEGPVAEFTESDNPVVRVPAASKVYADVNAGLQDVRVDLRAPEDGNGTSHRNERVLTGIGER